MKKIIQIILICFGVYTNLYAQTLPNITFTSIPSYGAPGITEGISVAPVPGATWYTWETITISGLLFNNLPGPVSTAVPTTNITFVLPQACYEVCVTAFSSCCSSATACIYITGSPIQIIFDNTNSVTALPNTFDDYSVVFTCNQNSSPIIYWLLTGDITFNNGLQFQSTANTTNQLNFGPGFTTGTLCAYTLDNFGIPSDTICMTINAPVGIVESSDILFNYHFDSQDNLLIIEIPEYSKSAILKITNAEGKLIYSDKIKNKFIEIDTRDYTNGIYLISIIENNKLASGKFILNR